MMTASAANTAAVHPPSRPRLMRRMPAWKAAWSIFAETQPGQNAPLGGLAQAMATPPRFVAEMGSHLARGGMEAVKSSLTRKAGAWHKPSAERRLSHSLQHS
ncbi:MAG: hypothetical protein ABS69_14150 [Nitrosomonadales bacterium SCN 54-20]|nr:MAG: hypothetical protein ABS69_14150 [Nitrosomonadales bacterium SCN 54-20]